MVDSIKYFKELEPNYTTNSDTDLTTLLLSFTNQANSVNNVYTNYYIDKKYDLGDFETGRTFGYIKRKVNPLIMNISVSFTEGYSGDYAYINKYSRFTTDQSVFTCPNFTIVNKSSNTEFTIIEGDYEEITINPNAISSGRTVDLSNLFIIPKYSELIVDDENIQYDELAVYNSQDKCYSIVLQNDGHYVLNFSSSLYDNILSFSSITLKYIFLEESLSPPSSIEFDSKAYTEDNDEIELVISDIIVRSEYSEPMDNGDILFSYGQAITKNDYETFIRNNPIVTSCKTYDISDVISGSVIEPDPSNIVVDLYVDNTNARASSKYVPFYMYAVILFNSDYNNTLNTNKEIITNYLKNIGMYSEELIIDYGNYEDVSTNGYIINEEYRPYKLPTILSEYNSDIYNDSESDSDYIPSYPGYNMPDLVIQILEAKSLPIDITLYLDISTSDSSELFTIYVNIVNKMKEIFSINGGKYSYNDNVIAKDIISSLYSVSAQIKGINNNGLIYYRDNISSGLVPNVQLAPDEIPMLGKLTIYLDYTTIQGSDNLLIGDTIDQHIAHFIHNENIIFDESVGFQIKLEERLILNDYDMTFDNKVMNVPLGLTFWYVIATEEKPTNYSDTTVTARTAVVSYKNARHSTTDDTRWSDDTVDEYVSDPEQVVGYKGLYTDDLPEGYEKIYLY